MKQLFHFAGSGVNLILDCVGGSFYEDNMHCLATEGRWVVYGQLGECSYIFYSIVLIFVFQNTFQRVNLIRINFLFLIRMIS